MKSCVVGLDCVIRGIGMRSLSPAPTLKTVGKGSGTRWRSRSAKPSRRPRKTKYCRCVFGLARADSGLCEVLRVGRHG